jgi:serine protease inhibitor
MSMHEKLADALGFVRDSFIAEATQEKKVRRPRWVGAVAAVLAAVILLNRFSLPMSVQATVVAEAEAARVMEYKSSGKFKTREEYRAYNDQRVAQHDAREAAVNRMLANCGLLADATNVFLSGSGSENRVWSPVNGYIGLAMLAETAGGNSRQQLLEVLGADSIENLRAQVSAVWESCYDDGNNPCLLANSLWLDNGLEYDQSVMDNLAHHHYASVYQGDLGSAKTDKALGSWLNGNTGGMLKKNADEVALPDDAVLALASTVYFQAKWAEEFHPRHNSSGLFHAPGGDLPCTYMNKEKLQGNYYWGDSFGAVRLNLKGNTSVWLFLPDQGKTPDDVLAQGQYMDMVTGNFGDPETYSKYTMINLTMPKFDISSSGNLKEGLEQLGITDVFDPGRADFTQAVQSPTPIPVHITAVNQALRVQVDEQGVKAAAYIEIPGAGAAAPPEEIIDFILDRPFLFVIADYSGIPLFAGVVNAP